jgi:hypothetical protein
MPAITPDATTRGTRGRSSPISDSGPVTSTARSFAAATSTRGPATRSSSATRPPESGALRCRGTSRRSTPPAHLGRVLDLAPPAAASAFNAVATRDRAPRFKEACAKLLARAPRMTPRPCSAAAGHRRPRPVLDIRLRQERRANRLKSWSAWERRANAEACRDRPRPRMCRSTAAPCLVNPTPRRVTRRSKEDGWTCLAIVVCQALLRPHPAHPLRPSVPGRLAMGSHHRGLVLRTAGP